MKVVQCWDDGVVTDGRLIDILRRHGAKATFNLNPGLMDPEKRGGCAWRKQGEGTWNHNFGFGVGKFSLREIPEIYSGFELASHCWRHENAGSIPDEEWIKSAMDARKFLEDIVQKPCRGFAWPCGISTQGTIDLLRENGFAYGRTTQNTYDVRDCDEPLALASNCHFKDPGFWDRYAKAKSTGVFYFWGHTYEMYQYDEMWDSFESMIKYISDDPDAEWADVIDIVPMIRGANSRP